MADVPDDSRQSAGGWTTAPSLRRARDSRSGCLVHFQQILRLRVTSHRAIELEKGVARRRWTAPSDLVSLQLAELRVDDEAQHLPVVYLAYRNAQMTEGRSTITGVAARACAASAVLEGETAGR